jgi:hypothetical protein
VTNPDQPAARDPDPRVRYEATVHSEDRHPAQGAADLDLDRVPDPEDRVRVLVTLEEAARLVELGFEVRLVRALPVTPLDPTLIMDDDAARASLEDRVRDIDRREGS